MIYKNFFKTIRGFTKSSDLVIRTKKLITKSHETVPLNHQGIMRSDSRTNLL
jgi:hypothetical protein